jgi:hypothetical protein
MSPRRTTALVLIAAAALSGCAAKKAGTPAALAGSTPPATATPRPSTTRLVIPTQVLPLDPCRLTPAAITQVVGFAVTRKAKNNPGQCEYVNPDGSVWFSVDASNVLDLKRAKADDTFSLGGRYVTIVDETGFAHETFTAVKNPGDKSPGVIADAEAFLAPGHLKLRIYYPQGGQKPGRANALTLLHKMLA